MTFSPATGTMLSIRWQLTILQPEGGLERGTWPSLSSSIQVTLSLEKLMNSVTDTPFSVNVQIRRFVARTRGLTHRPVIRLMSPSNLRDQLKPFVFLDLCDVDFNDPRGRFPTLTAGLRGRGGRLRDRNRLLRLRLHCASVSTWSIPRRTRWRSARPTSSACGCC